MHASFQHALGNGTLVIETGKLAQQANGSVVLRYGDNVFLAAATMGQLSRPATAPRPPKRLERRRRIRCGTLARHATLIRIKEKSISKGTQETGVDTAEKQAVMAEYANSENDTGSAEVQVAVLTARISRLTDHLREHKHDESTRRGLLKLVGRRRRLLRYLNGEDVGRYRTLITRLGLRR